MCLTDVGALCDRTSERFSTQLFEIDPRSDSKSKAARGGQGAENPKDTAKIRRDGRSERAAAAVPPGGERHPVHARRRQRLPRRRAALELDHRRLELELELSPSLLPPAGCSPAISVRPLRAGARAVGMARRRRQGGPGASVADARSSPGNSGRRLVRDDTGRLCHPRCEKISGKEIL